MGHNCCFVYCVISANEADKGLSAALLTCEWSRFSVFPLLVNNPADRTATEPPWTEPNIRIETISD